MGNLPTKWAADRAADLADKYLSRYFKGFDKSQIRLGLGGGVIELGPLEMRPEAFLHSENAVEIKAGYIGRLSIRLPNLLAAGPFSIHIEGVYLLLGLATRREWDDEAEQKAKRARHQAAIAAAEQLLHNLQRGLDAEELAMRMKGIDAFFRQETFAIKKVLHLIAQLRLDIQDVMVVLDEDRLMPSHPFALGLIIRSVEMASEPQGPKGTRETASADGTASAASRPAAAGGAGQPSASAEEGVIRKTLVVKGMSIRVVPRESALPMEFVAVADTSEIFERVLGAAMQAALPLCDFDQGLPELRLVLHRGAALKRAGELGVLHIDAPGLRICIHEGQLRVVSHLLEYFSNFARLHPNRRCQPMRRVRAGCEPALVRAWWQWALQGVLSELTRRRTRRLALSWSQLLHRRDLRRRYVQLFLMYGTLEQGEERKAGKARADRGDVARRAIAEAEKVEMLQIEDKLTVMDVIFFRSLARAQIAEASSAIQGVAQRSYFELLSHLFQAEVHVRVVWCTRTFSLFLHNEAEALNLYQERYDKISRQMQKEQQAEALEQARDKAQNPPPHTKSEKGTAAAAVALPRVNRLNFAAFESVISSRALRLSSIIQLESTGIQMQITLRDSSKEVVMTAETVLVLDRYSHSTPCRRCLESVCDPLPAPPAATPSVEAWRFESRPVSPCVPVHANLQQGSDPDMSDSAANAPAACSPGETSDTPSVEAPAATPLLGTAGLSATNPFLDLRIEVLDKESPPSQSITLELSPLHCVLTPTLITRLCRWAVDGWGGAHIYGHYLLLWIYRYEHIVAISTRGIEAVLLNSQMGCAPLFHLHCEPVSYVSRYSCDQMHTTTLDLGLELNYANARNGMWEPLLEPCEVRLATQHNRHTQDYQMEVSVPTAMNANVTADLVDTLIKTYALKRQRTSESASAHEAPLATPPPLDLENATRLQSSLSLSDIHQLPDEKRFQLVNLTGAPLDFWPSDPTDLTSGAATAFASGAALHGAALHLENGTACSFDFWDERSEGIGLRAILAPAAGCHICIRCTQCQPSVVRIDFGGMNTFSTRGAGGLLYAVVVHVSQEARCTRVVVRSPVQLRNTCAFPLEALLYSPQTAREQVLGIPSDSELSVPLSLSTDVMVRVRPVHAPTDGRGGVYRWSAPLVVGRMGEQERVHCTLKEAPPDEDAGVEAPAQPMSGAGSWCDGMGDVTEEPQPWDSPWQVSPPAPIFAFGKVFRCCVNLEVSSPGKWTREAEMLEREVRAQRRAGSRDGLGTASPASPRVQQQQVLAVHGSRGGGDRLLKPCRLSFDPPLVVQNALLCPCRIELRNVENPRLTRERQRDVLPRGGQLAWLSANLALPLTMRLQLPHSNWSGIVTLSRPNAFKAPDRLTVVTRNSTHFAVSLEHRRLPSGAVSLALYCQYWIVNLTRLPLQYASSNAKGARATREKEETTAAVGGDLLNEVAVNPPPDLGEASVTTVDSAQPQLEAENQDLSPAKRKEEEDEEDEHTTPPSSCGDASQSGGQLSNQDLFEGEELEPEVTRARALVLLLQVAEELEATQEDSKAKVPFESATVAAAKHSGVLDRESELAMKQVQELINKASDCLEPYDVRPAIISRSVELSQLGLQFARKGETQAASTCFHEAALLLPTLPSLLSAALMRLKNKQSLLALPLYTFVLHHAEDGSKELEMARARLDEAATDAEAAATPHSDNAVDYSSSVAFDASETIGNSEAVELATKLERLCSTTFDDASDDDDEEEDLLRMRKRPSAEMVLAAAAVQAAAAEVLQLSPGKSKACTPEQSVNCESAATPENASECGGACASERGSSSAQPIEEVGLDEESGSRLRSAAMELTKKLELHQAASSGFGWSFRDLKAALTTRLESAEPSVRKGSMELLAMLRANIKESFRPAHATSDKMSELLGYGAEVESISKMASELPGQAAHTFEVSASIERATEMGYPALPSRASSFESAHARASDRRVTEGRVMMFGMTRELFRSRCCLRLPGGSWSNGFYLGSLAAGGVVAVEQRENAPAASSTAEVRTERSTEHQARLTYELGVSSGMAGGLFWRTKLISISYRFMLTNRCGRDLVLRQIGGKHKPLLLAAGQRCAWNWPQRHGTSFSAQPMMSVCIVSDKGARGRWSSAFGLHDLGQLALKLWPAASVESGASLRAQHGGAGVPFVLRVEVSLLRATVLVRFVAEDKSTPPYRLVNLLHTAAYCSQSGVPGVSTFCAPQCGAAYVLEAPSLPPVVQLSLPQLSPGVLAEINLTRIGEQTSFVVPNTAHGESLRVYCIVSSEGPTKVLTMADHPLLSAQADLVEQDQTITAKYLLSIEAFGLSLLDSKPQELLYLSCAGMQLELACTSAAMSLQASIRTLQLDNQLVCSTYPVLLRANPRAHARNPQFMQLSVLYLRKHTSLHYLRHMSVFLQELDVALDWELFTPVAELVVHSLKQLADANMLTTHANRATEGSGALPSGGVEGVEGGDACDTSGPSCGSATASGAACAAPLTNASSSSEAVGGRASPSYAADVGTDHHQRPPPRKCYVEILTLHPIVLNFTSSSSTGFANMQRLGANAPLSQGHFIGGYAISALNAIGVMLTSVENAKLRLNALVLRHPCEHVNDLLSRIGRHYIYQASQALLRIAGDLDLLGSPVALLGNLGSGVRDFFYEPANALLYSPRELHLAVAKGTLSLMRNTVLSTVNATSKVSGTLGKGLAALSMDDSFVRRRAARMAAQRPRSLAQGLRDGARNLGEAVAEGAAGLITSPLDGARRDGVKGAIVGVAQGVMGVALKPATGVLDLATKSTESMRHASARPAQGLDFYSDEATGRARARPPRALGPDSHLQVYDQSKAALREVLLRVDAGAYRGEDLIGYVGLGAYSLLCTESRLLHVRTSNWVQSWQVPWGRLKSCSVQSDKKAVLLELFSERFDYVFGQTSRQIPCDGASALLVYAAVQEGRAQYTERLVVAALNTPGEARKLRKAVSHKRK